MVHKIVSAGAAAMLLMALTAVTYADTTGATMSNLSGSQKTQPNTVNSSLSPSAISTTKFTLGAMPKDSNSPGFLSSTSTKSTSTKGTGTGSGTGSASKAAGGGNGGGGNGGGGTGTKGGGTAPVPEPATLILLGTGITGVLAKVRKRRNGLQK